MSPHPDAAPILDAIEGFRRSKAMFTAVRLGIFNRLEKDPQDAARLASALQVNAAALERLLNGCVSLGLLTRDGDTYRNTLASSRYLVADSPETLAGYITYSDQSLYQLWSHLDDAIREGTNRWTQTFGSRDALFAHFFRDDASTASFLSGMHGFGRLSSPLVVRAFDLGRFTHLVDLGGATGHLAIAACEAYPALLATVFDLPRVEPFARSHIEQSAVSNRVTFTAGDFFTDNLPAADLYSLGRILHDWPESQIHSLLSKILKALPCGGALLLAETLVGTSREGPVYSLMQDLNMLVCTEGRERSHAQYAALLEAAGFVQVASRVTGSVLDAIVAVKE